MPAAPVDPSASPRRNRRAGDRPRQTERRRQPDQLAQLLHDDLAQLLTLALMRLDEARPAPDEPQAGLARAQAQAQARELVQSALRATRQAIRSLQPAPVGDLASALRATVERLSCHFGLPLHWRGAAELPPVPEGVAAALLAAVQELCVNAGKHAGGAAVEVSLWRRGAGLTLQVRDQGQGLDVAKQAALPCAAGGFGLPSLHSRLAAAGLSLELHSRPGYGVDAQVCWPGMGGQA